MTARSVTRMLATAGLVGAAFAVVPAAASAQQDDLETATTQADVDGDGRMDGVTVHEATADSQTLTFGLAGGEVDVTIPWDSSYPLPDPRAVDVNGDGTHEVMVAETVGANTITFNIWHYDPAAGIVAVTTPDGAPLQVFEGGGVSVHTGYSCLDDHTTREFVTVNAQVTGTPDDTPVYEGERISYLVVDGVANETNRVEFSDVTREDPVMQVHPESCGVA